MEEENETFATIGESRLMVTIKDYQENVKKINMDAYYVDEDGKEHLINEHLIKSPTT